ncbi:MAG: class I SAM-dependent methyltransferase [Nocardioidaceae bacterium]|nr:class I SAM-dependent methyltransferase [Nocardioidaceae bacterium]
MTPPEDRLEAFWPFVRAQLPTPGSRVIEIGCGPLGGFVPRLDREGYDAVGIDPEAPESPGYHRVEFERFQLPQPVDAVVACTSLHHVADLDDVLDRVASALVTGGVVVVVEWASERFDEATAKWCFSRLENSTTEDDHGWLHKHRDDWLASQHDWDTYLRGWAKHEGLHPGQQIVQGLDARFERAVSTFAPYFFPDLADTSEADEQRAIDAGLIQATGVRHAARLTR